MKKSGASQANRLRSSSRKESPNSGLARGNLSRMRKLIKEADPDVVEEWKWMGTRFGRTRHHLHWRSYKNVVSLPSPRARLWKDPARLFNSSSTET